MPWSIWCLSLNHYCIGSTNHHLNRPDCHSLHGIRPAFCLNWSQIVAINVETLRSLSLYSRLFPLVLPSFGSFAGLGPAPQCPGIIHGGLLHVPSFGQMCSLFATISNLRAGFLLALQLGRFVHTALWGHPDHKADNPFPHLTTDNLRYCSMSKSSKLLERRPLTLFLD